MGFGSGEQWIVYPGHHGETGLLTCCRGVHRDVVALQIGHQVVVDPYTVPEQQVLQSHLVGQGHGGPVGQAVGEGTDRIHEEQHLPSPHDILVDGELVGFAEVSFGLGNDQGLIIEQRFQVPVDIAAVHLEKILQLVHQTVRLQGIQLPVSLDKGDFGDLVQGQAVDGLGEFVFQGLDGIVQVDLVGKGRIVLQQVHGHFMALVEDHRSREDDLSRNSALFIPDLHIGHLQSPLVKIGDHPVAHRFIGFVIHIDEFILQPVSRIGPEFIQQLPDGFPEIHEFGRQLPGQVDPDKYNIIQAVHELPGGGCKGIPVL